MKQVTRLYQRLQKPAFEQKYPGYDLRDGKIHVLFIGTYLNGTGYYRHIVPAHELNQTDSHVAIVCSLHKWDYNHQFGDSDKSPIVPELISWADYVVLPPLFDDAQYFFTALRDHNERMQIVMDLDQNFHCIPQEHPAYPSLNSQQKRYLLKNLAQSDIVTLATEGLYYYYERQLQKHFPESTTYLSHIPNYLSALAYENARPIEKNKDEAVRIGLVGGSNSSFDFSQVVSVLKSIKEQHEGKTEIIIFGWNGRIRDVAVLENLDVTFVKSVRFTDYFEKLNSLSLDIALLPLTDQCYNTHGRSPVRYFELSASGIPVIASDLPPFNLVIEDEETGLLAEDEQEWLSQINRLIESPELRISLSENALKSSWYDHAYNWEKLELLTSLYR